ncbi:GNAT family N-acetyltransferase [Hoyosella sp. YIM 151337]|uniref:GNAT family N-acetyltransferase n=1 Tax=Hoyosella sp. YIM 151337 TaxID=2992742 RepID=UPI0022369B0A|nr:GNAT family N-acetyltransferase [Hoyosella sp. YIM 151337]MCW4355414.1 GNAT family N-acetyltransferase [Hoyosella sp. YIM 151337]
MHEALSIYVAAMGYAPSVAKRRAPMWAEHALRQGWRGVGAVLPERAEPPSRAETSQLAPVLGAHLAPLVGVAYGYSGAPEQWWYKQVHAGLEAHHGPMGADHILEDYFELTELHVHPEAQGQGVGNALIGALLDARPESSVLLSTPEIAEEDNRAWRLYRRLGFADVLRDFHFDGDPRPFAVLGRELPL